MPLYFFHVCHIHHQRFDVDGLDLPDVEAAWHEATTSTGELLKDLGGGLRPGQDWSMQVADEFKNTLFEIRIEPISHVEIDSE